MLFFKRIYLDIEEHRIDICTEGKDPKRQGVFYSIINTLISD